MGFASTHMIFMDFGTIYHLNYSNALWYKRRYAHVVRKILNLAFLGLFYIHAAKSCESDSPNSLLKHLWTFDMDTETFLSQTLPVPFTRCCSKYQWPTKLNYCTEHWHKEEKKEEGSHTHTYTHASKQQNSSLRPSRKDLAHTHMCSTYTPLMYCTYTRICFLYGRYCNTVNVLKSCVLRSNFDAAKMISWYILYR